MGTYAGIDLLKKIAANTPAGKDQEHLPVVMISRPHLIEDRTEYLFGEVEENPGVAIAEVIRELVVAGSELIGLPCNTAHVQEIIAEAEIGLSGKAVLVNMISEVADYIHKNFPDVRKAGIMGTNGVFSSRVYDDYLSGFGISTLYPDKALQFEVVHPSIYDPVYGIKAVSDPITEKAHSDLIRVARELKKNGAELIVLGCTEIPLAITGEYIYNIPVIDASDILARALVREALG